MPRAVSLQHRQQQSSEDAKNSCERLEQRPTNVLRVFKYAEQKLDNAPDHLRNLTENSNEAKRRRSIGVCVQALRFGNLEYSVRMVEWLEMVRILGADKVYLYVHDVSRHLQKVLRHYQQEVCLLLSLAFYIN